MLYGVLMRVTTLFTIVRLAVSSREVNKKKKKKGAVRSARGETRVRFGGTDFLKKKKKKKKTNEPQRPPANPIFGARPRLRSGAGVFTRQRPRPRLLNEKHIIIRVVASFSGGEKGKKEGLVRAPAVVRAGFRLRLRGWRAVTNLRRHHERRESFVVGEGTADAVAHIRERVRQSQPVGHGVTDGTETGDHHREPASAGRTIARVGERVS